MNDVVDYVLCNSFRKHYVSGKTLYFIVNPVERVSCFFLSENILENLDQGDKRSFW